MQKAPSLPVELRPHIKSVSMHALSEELAQLAERHNLRGLVIVAYSGDEVWVTSSGVPGPFAAAMEKLGDDILCSIDDGYFDGAAQ